MREKNIFKKKKNWRMQKTLGLKHLEGAKKNTFLGCEEKKFDQNIWGMQSRRKIKDAKKRLEVAKTKYLEDAKKHVIKTFGGCKKKKHLEDAKKKHLEDTEKRHLEDAKNIWRMQKNNIWRMQKKKTFGGCKKNKTFRGYRKKLENAEKKHLEDLKKDIWRMRKKNI